MRIYIAKKVTAMIWQVAFHHGWIYEQRGSDHPSNSEKSMKFYMNFTNFIHIFGELLQFVP